MIYSLDFLKEEFYCTGFDEFIGYENFVNIRLNLDEKKYQVNLHDTGQLVVDADDVLVGEWKENGKEFIFISDTEQFHNANPIEGIKDFIRSKQSKQ